MEEQKNEETNWLEEEVKNLKDTSFDGEKLPALKLEENKMTEMTIDFTKPFEKWNDVENNTVKKISPVTTKDGNFVWWLNVKNPIYGLIVKAGNEGKKDFKILQTGSQAKTKYNIVE